MREPHIDRPGTSTLLPLIAAASSSGPKSAGEPLQSVHLQDVIGSPFVLWRKEIQTGKLPHLTGKQTYYKRKAALLSITALILISVELFGDSCHISSKPL